MVTKNDCIFIFNSMIRGTPIDFKNLINLISDYLTEIKYEKSEKLITLISMNPNLAEKTLPTLEEYYVRKFDIFKLIYNNKIILYYD